MGMGGFVLAWGFGEGIVVYRWVKLKAPPTPGALLWSSVLFAALAVVAQYQPARTTATVAAWGLDLAILLQVVGKAPQGVTGWPPPEITDPTVILPNGASGAVPAPAAAGAGAGKSPGTPLGNAAKGIVHWFE